MEACIKLPAGPVVPMQEFIPLLAEGKKFAVCIVGAQADVLMKNSILMMTIHHEGVGELNSLNEALAPYTKGLFVLREEYAD